MTPTAIERVFGRTRLKMVTGQYVEVYREAAEPGERRRYTKRFLSTTEGDFRDWTEREWRILARLVGHGVKCVPDVVQFDRGSAGATALVQTYDAGVTIDHWQSLLPVRRDGRTLRHVFEDCAHWWALAHHFLLALKEIHELQVVHLDVKADNICIPFDPPDFRPDVPGQRLTPVFRQLALIDFAFSLVSGERLSQPLPIGWQPDYAYQSPRLLKALMAGRNGDLQPTRELDWRCDMYSLAAMLTRFLPAPERVRGASHAAGWNDDRYVDAKVLLLKIRDSHDRDASTKLPHDRLIELTAARFADEELAQSLEAGWLLATEPGADQALAPTVPMTPVTRIEPLVRPITLIDEVVPASNERPPLHTSPEARTSAPEVRLRASDDATSDPSPQLARKERATATTPAHRSPRRRWVYAVPLVAVIVSLPFIDRATKSTGGTQQASDASSPAQVAAGLAREQGNGRDAVQPEATGPSVSVLPQDDASAVLSPAVSHGSAPSRTTPAAPAAQQQRAAPNDAALPTARSQRDDYARRANAIVSNALPGFAEQVAAQVAQVLLVAADARAAAQDGNVIEAVRSIAANPQEWIGLEGGSPSSARRFNAAAKDAFWTRRDVAEALELQRRAFGANPHDPEIAGNLAFYHLKATPPQPEIARRLALHSLAAAIARSGSARMEDWGNMAVASALSGRREDATNAMFVLLAVAKDLNRACKAALSALASHGEAMRAPSEAMLARIEARGGAPAAPYCGWPPNWHAGVKFP